DYLTLLAICIPTTFAACMVGAFVSNFMGSELKDDPIYQERLTQGLIKLAGTQKREILPTAKTATYIILTAINLVVCYA
ncbi:anaerobic C4-dicarboxylate transporter family protein, partial [Vibrio cholerae]|uniref:anaerobic C4-dicarboxylate transporter family protein n=1 Tax=Vibrio cholerae TaxID=666 RepID=UPI001A30D0FF